jgi:hypothetical protein
MQYPAGSGVLSNAADWLQRMPTGTVATTAAVVESGICLDSLLTVRGG